MEYSIKAHSASKGSAHIVIKEADLAFGISSATDVANPAEIFLSALVACILKSVERMSVIMKFEYSKAEISINAIRLEKPPRMDSIKYHLVLHSQDQNLNIELLKKNIEQHGTIFNTVKSACTIKGNIELVLT